MKSLLVGIILMASAFAHADIQWQMTGEKQVVSKIEGFTIQGQSLIIVSGSTSYTISKDVAESTGLSMKELLDLLKEYDASKVKVLYFNGQRDGFDVKSIGALVAFPKI